MTHVLHGKEKSQVYIGKSGYASLDNHFAGRRIIGTGEVAAESESAKV